MLSEKPWKPVDFALIMALLGTLLLGGALSGVLGAQSKTAPEAPNQLLNFIVSLCLYGVILGLVHVIVKSRGVDWSTAFGLNSRRPLSGLLMAVGVTAIMLPIAWVLQMLSVEIMQRVHLSPVVQSSVQMVETSASFSPRVFLAILAIVIAPVTEELLFRGVLYPFVKQHGYPKTAMWGTAALFGAMHLNLMTFVPLTFLGLVLAWLYETTDNLLVPILAHSLFNLANFLRALLEGGG